MLTMFILGFNEKKNNLKYEINNIDKVFEIIKGYGKYTGSISPENINVFRQYIMKLMNSKHVSQDVKEILGGILDFVIQVQKRKTGLYWY